MSMYLRRQYRDPSIAMPSEELYLHTVNRSKKATRDLAMLATCFGAHIHVHTRELCSPRCGLSDSQSGSTEGRRPETGLARTCSLLVYPLPIEGLGPWGTRNQASTAHALMRTLMGDGTLAHSDTCAQECPTYPG